VGAILVSRPALGKAAVLNLLGMGVDEALVGLAPRLYGTPLHEWLEDQNNVVLVSGTDSFPVAPAKNELYSIAADERHADWVLALDDDDVAIRPYRTLGKFPSDVGTVHGGTVRLDVDAGYQFHSRWDTTRHVLQMVNPVDGNKMRGSYWAISGEAWREVARNIQTPGDLFWFDFRLAYWSLRLGYKDVVEPGIFSVTCVSPRGQKKHFKERKFPTWEGMVGWMNNRPLTK